MVGLIRQLAYEFAPAVRVNGVAPGPIEPPGYLSAEEREESAVRTLVGRWGGPAEIARAIAFLIESDYVNGVVLPVDGGRTISD